MLLSQWFEAVSCRSPHNAYLAWLDLKIEGRGRGPFGLNVGAQDRPRARPGSQSAITQGTLRQMWPLILIDRVILQISFRIFHLSVGLDRTPGGMRALRILIPMKNFNSASLP